MHRGDFVVLTGPVGAGKSTLLRAVLGLSWQSEVVGEVRAAKAGFGLNIDTGEMQDLVKSGIIDPTKVTRSALQNAASIAKNILTTEAVVVDAPEKPGAAPAGMPDMGGMM